MHIQCLSFTLTNPDIYVIFSGDNCKESGHTSIIFSDIHKAINRTARNRFVAHLNGDYCEASSGV